MNLLRLEIRKLSSRRDLRLLLLAALLLIMAVSAYRSQRENYAYSYERSSAYKQYQQYRQDLEDFGENSALASLYGADDVIFQIKQDAAARYRQLSFDVDELAATYASTRALEAFDLNFPLILSMFVLLLLSLALFTQEWEGEMIDIQRGLKYGGRRLFWSRTLAIYLLTWFSFSLFFIMQSLISCLLYGPLPLGAALQIVPRFLYSILPGNIAELFLLLILYEGAALLPTALIMACLASFFRRRNSLMLAATSLLSVEILLYSFIWHQDQLHWFKELNLFPVLLAGTIWEKPIYITVASHWIRWETLILIFALFLFVLFSFLGAGAWRMKRSLSKNSLWQRRKKGWPRQRSLREFERYKLLVSQKSGLLLLGLFVLSVYLASQFKDYKDTRAYYYDIYCRRVAAMTVADARVVLDREAKHFDSLLAEQQACVMKKAESEQERLTQHLKLMDLGQRLIPLDALRDLQMELQLLERRPGARVLNQRDWLRLAGREAMRDLIFALILFSLTMMLGLSQIFYADRVREMNRIQAATAAGLERLDYIKVSLAYRYALIGYFLAVLPLLIKKIIDLRPTALLASTNSLLFFSSGSALLPNLGWLVLLYGLALLLAVQIVRVILALGRQGKNLSAIFGRVLLLIVAPLIIAWVLLA